MLPADDTHWPAQVAFIGAGPGQADLITLRGARRLASAQVVLHDALTDPALRALAPQAQWLDVGKRGFAHATAQPAINALLLQMAQQHERVARLKGGDPSIFGRLEEEIAAVRGAGYRCEVVPGITAALAGAAQAALPLTRRGSGRTVSFSTAMTRLGTLLASRTADTEVFYMAGRQLGELALQLQRAGWPADTPVLAVSRAGWPDARISHHQIASLHQAEAVHAGRPTVVTVGAGARTLAADAAP